MRKKLTLGVFGFGVVGQGLYEVLNQTTLIDAEIKHIVVKDETKTRSIEKRHFSFDPKTILEDDEVDTVVELIDDADAAYKIVMAALKRGKNVVSANKKMVAYHIDELVDVARENEVSFIYEAAVCASIPILRTLEEYYNTDSIESIEGVCNGTTNYIFSQTDKGKTYDDALREAQELGFAESDPTLDVDGYDAKFKLCIMIKHAYGLSVKQDEVLNYGIRHVKPEDVFYGKQNGYRLKLISHVRREGDELVAFVAPHFVSDRHPTYDVNGSFNAVAVKGLFADQQTLIGRGAGSHPTASAVLSDISALQYDYNYEYKKESIAGNLSLNDDLLIRVYAGSASSQELAEVQFQKVEEAYTSSKYNYKTGYVPVQLLKTLQLNARENLFLAVIPE